MMTIADTSVQALCRHLMRHDVNRPAIEFCGMQRDGTSHAFWRVKLGITRQPAVSRSRIVIDPQRGLGWAVASHGLSLALRNCRRDHHHISEARVWRVSHEHVVAEFATIEFHGNPAISRHEFIWGDSKKTHRLLLIDFSVDRAGAWSHFQAPAICQIVGSGNVPGLFFLNPNRLCCCADNHGRDWRRVTLWIRPGLRARRRSEKKQGCGKQNR